MWRHLRTLRDVPQEPIDFKSKQVPPTPLQSLTKFLHRDDRRSANLDFLGGTGIDPFHPINTTLQFLTVLKYALGT